MTYSKQELAMRWRDASSAINAITAELGLAADDPHFVVHRIWMRYATAHRGGYQVIIAGECVCGEFWSIHQLREQISNIVANSRRYSARWWQL